MDEQRAVQYLESLIGKTLRVHATDTRIFVGVFKCTDATRNIILSSTHEYRHPTTAAIRDAALQAAPDSESLQGKMQNLKLNMTSRFIGLVVVPGQHITKIELEETKSQT